MLIFVYLVSLGVYVYLHPPKIIIETYLPTSIRVEVQPTTVKVPDNILLSLDVKTQTRAPDAVYGGQAEGEPIPEHIAEYCELESDEWARVARKKRARLLRAELGSWDAAFRALQREDNPVTFEEPEEKSQ